MQGWIERLPGWIHSSAQALGATGCVTPDTILYEEIDEFDGRPRLCQHDTGLFRDVSSRGLRNCLKSFRSFIKLVAIQDGYKTKRLIMFASTATLGNVAKSVATLGER